MHLACDSGRRVASSERQPIMRPAVVAQPHFLATIAQISGWLVLARLEFRVPDLAVHHQVETWKSCRVAGDANFLFHCLTGVPVLRQRTKFRCLSSKVLWDEVLLEHDVISEQTHPSSSRSLWSFTHTTILETSHRDNKCHYRF